MLDILVAAEDAVSFASGRVQEEFMTNALLRHAVLHCLTIIGEAAGRIAESTQAEAPDLPWRRMKNLRNVIIHDYEGVNLPLVWDIVQSELRPLIDALAPLFPERSE